MKPKLLLCLALVLSGDSPASEPATDHQPQTLAHHWEYITFPRGSPEDKQQPDFMVGWPGWPEHSNEISRGLRLAIMNIGQGFGFFKTNAITARLHRANGEVVEPTAEEKKLLNVPAGLSSGTSPNEEPAPQVQTYFPWGTNALAESWIEVTIGSERYWLEIPYGFDRNPRDPLAPSIPGGRPRLAKAMKLWTRHDHLVPWQSVHYFLGRTVGDCELALIQSNPVHARSEVDLYTDQGARSVYSPHTEVRLLVADGGVVNGRCVNIHLDDNYLRRTDTFDIGNRGADDSRCWGKIEIGVDDKRYQVVVPSSLYKYTHGHADKPGLTTK